MEKDYFDDRSYQAIFNCLLEPGDIAWICTKEKQPIAKTIDDLDKVIIVRKLTSVKKHLRGVKIMGFKLRRDYLPTQKEIETVLRYYEKYKDEIDQEIPGTKFDKFIKGRVTYLVSPDGQILYG